MSPTSDTEAVPLVLDHDGSSTSELNDKMFDFEWKGIMNRRKSWFRRALELLQWNRCGWFILTQLGLLVLYTAVLWASQWRGIQDSDSLVYCTYIFYYIMRPADRP